MRERIPREHMAEMKAVRYPSSDGLEIPAFLTLPKGVPAKGLPAILVPHGGPWARDGWGFNNLAQFLANRGYAVLQPNFRGSTGYGKKFLNAGNKQWGDKMQDDVTWGAKYLVAQGIADPKRVGIMGGSYGGYATLAGVAFTPDLYAAAVVDRRPLEPHHAPRLHPALLGGRPDHLPRAHGQPEDAGGQGPARRGSRRSTPRRRSRPRSSWPRAPTTRASRRRSRSRS